MTRKRANSVPDLRDWLLNEAEARMLQAHARRDMAKATHGASEQDLRSSKRLAEKMWGRKLTMVSTDPRDNEIQNDIQLRIADKLETEARKLEAWAEMVTEYVPRRDKP